MGIPAVNATINGLKNYRKYRFYNGSYENHLKIHFGEELSADDFIPVYISVPFKESKYGTEIELAKSSFLEECILTSEIDYKGEDGGADATGLVPKSDSIRCLAERLINEKFSQE